MVLFDVLFDVLLLLVIGFGVFYGIYKGFIKVLEIPFKMVSSFILAFLASTYLSSTLVLPLIEEPIVDRMSSYIVERCTEGKSIPVFYRLLGINEAALDSGIEAIAADIVSPMVTIISAVITFIVALILGKIIISLIFSLINLVFKIKPLRRISKVLGGILGFIVFFVIASVFVGVMMLCDSIGLLDKVGFLSGFEGGYVYKFVTLVWSAFF